MIIDSITHVLQSILEYTELIIALLLYLWIKDVFGFTPTHVARTFSPQYRMLKSRKARILIHDELFILYQWIRQFRQKHNLTQEKLAEKVGVAPRTIQRWESGTRPQPRHYSMFQKLERERPIGQNMYYSKKMYYSRNTGLPSLLFMLVGMLICGILGYFNPILLSYTVIVVLALLVICTVIAIVIAIIRSIVDHIK